MDQRPTQDQDEDDWPEFRHDWDLIKKRIFEDFAINKKPVNQVQAQDEDCSGDQFEMETPVAEKKKTQWITKTQRRRARRTMAENRRRWAAQWAAQQAREQKQ